MLVNPSTRLTDRRAAPRVYRVCGTEEVPSRPGPPSAGLRPGSYRGPRQVQVGGKTRGVWCLRNVFHGLPWRNPGTSSVTCFSVLLSFLRSSRAWHVSCGVWETHDRLDPLGRLVYFLQPTKGGRCLRDVSLFRSTHPKSEQEVTKERSISSKSQVTKTEDFTSDCRF